MPTKPDSDEEPEAFPVTDDTSVVVSTVRTFERHPDGSGLRPIHEHERGDLTLPCPACGGVLIRDSGRDVWERSIVRCPNPKCDKLFSGKSYPGKSEAYKLD